MRALGLFVFLAVAVSAQPAPEAGRVVGAVVEAETGEPVPGATVRLVGTALGAAADGDGRFVIEGVPPGEHEVEALFVGAEPWRATVRVGVGEAVGVRPTLTFVALCDCVIEVARPEPFGRGAYQARVVEYLDVETSCCTWWTVRRDAPVGRWATR